MIHAAPALAIALWLAPGLPGAGPALPAFAPLPADTVGALPVPYVAQSVLLCGGAAVVMVERWWGRRGVYAEEFRHLVRPELNGILTTELSAAARQRGWRTEAGRGSPAGITAALAAGVPPIALIEVAADRYHFVVVLRWTGTAVTYHDPAVGPSATLATERFLQRWEAAGDWMMLLQPGPDPEPAAVVGPAATSRDAAAPLPCAPWLDQAIDAAGRDQLAEAERLLMVARTNCPQLPIVLRELAGIQFRQRRYPDAASLTAQYLRQAPDDSLAWQLLGSSEFLAGRPTAALRAWNAIGRPTVDLVVIAGNAGTRHRALYDAMAISPGRTLTPRGFGLAERRLAQVPAVASSRVSYEPVAGGLADLQAAISDRPLHLPLQQFLAVSTVRAVASHEAIVSLHSLLGRGERWEVAWRWEGAHLRRSGSLEIPARLGVPGVVSVQSAWERFRLADADPGQPPTSARRRRSTLGFHSWLVPALEALTGVGVERWEKDGQFLTVALGAGLHGWEDRGVLLARGETALPLDGRRAHRRLEALAGWASSPRPAPVRWSARIGAEWASEHSPRGRWPVAGGNAGRAIPLRAHRYAPGSVLPAARTGRLMVHGGLSAERAVATVGPFGVGAGLFLDAARVSRRDAGLAARAHYLDGGIGIQLGVAGAPDRTVRLDLARGFVSEPGWQVQVGVQQSWGSWLRDRR